MTFSEQLRQEVMCAIHRARMPRCSCDTSRLPRRGVDARLADAALAAIDKRFPTIPPVTPVAGALRA